VSGVVDTKLFVSMFVAYVGLDPEKDINWVTVPNWNDQVPLLQQGKIDAFFAGPPGNLEMREKGIGHVLVSTTTDKPWSEYACCLVASTKEFVRKYPVATKRALRAILKGVDLCASDPSGVARVFADRGLGGYEITLRALRELPFGKWRELDVADSLRFWALCMHDVGRSRAAHRRSLIKVQTCEKLELTRFGGRLRTWHVRRGQHSASRIAPETSNRSRSVAAAGCTSLR
jgi:NitT/TauT family transport system substrate-binding protein